VDLPDLYFLMRLARKANRLRWATGNPNIWGAAKRHSMRQRGQADVARRIVPYPVRPWS